ncbi:MAG: PD40 domain-containing protein [Anaerolineae bacterium]|nr:PD40 domain-containing protein [Anaerolineae bacterium]
MKRWGRWLIMGGIALVVIIAAAAIWIYRQLDQETIELGATEGELVFMSDRDGNWDLYMQNKEGELINITAASEADEYYPNFTFNGDQLSLYSNAPGAISPARVNPDGTGFKAQTVIEAMLDVIKEGNLDWDPVWSPGGARLAWDKVVAGLPPKMDLFVANSDGTDRVQLTNDAATEYMHAWSPDGTRIVYTSDKSGYQNIYVVEVASGEITRLTEHDIHDYQPVYALDGEKILLIFSDPDSMLEGKIEFHVMNADGTDLHPLGDDEVFKGDLTHSPYGGQIAYMSNESGYWHIYVMDADGSNVKQLTDGESNNLFPVWRPVPVDESETDDSEGE